jgi:hypothetical protein
MYWYILVLLSSNFPNEIYYLLFFLMGFFLIFKATILPLFLKKTLKKNRFKFRYWTDLIPLIFFVVWIYGIFIGFLMGNKSEYISRNFFGMITYLTYYMIVSQISKKNLYKAIYISSIIVITQNITLVFIRDILSIDIFTNGAVELIFGKLSSGASTGQERIYYPGQMLIFGYTSLAASRILSSQNLLPATTRMKKVVNRFLNHLPIFRKISATLSFFIGIYVMVFVPASKGYLLGLIVLVLVIIAGLSFSFRKLKIKRGFIVFVAVTAGVSLFFLGSNYSNILSSIFDSEDVANAARYDQLSYLVNDIHFFGNGLGAVLPDGYQRNSDLPYGFELTYINLLHKFGAFSILLYGGYLVTLVKSFQFLRKKDFPLEYSSYALGIMFFMFPSIGNPLLMNPQMILLHCSALALVRDIEYKT